MTSREQILNAIKANKPQVSPLPEVPLFDLKISDNIDKFSTILSSIGGYVEPIASVNDIETKISELYPNAKNVASTFFKGTIAVNENTSKYDLEQIDLAVLKGEFGVAENGTIWVPEANMLHRALPFITQHLVLVLNKNEIVANMHLAYQKLQSVGNYGVFIAGPSKTADIEQSLVIGAHGARSMTVLMY